MPSEDVLFSITSPSSGTAGLSEADFAGIRGAAGFGGAAEIRTEIIGRALARRPGQVFYGACAPWVSDTRLDRMRGPAAYG
jgi:hypothetical protein